MASFDYVGYFVLNYIAYRTATDDSSVECFVNCERTLQELVERTINSE